MVRVFCIFSKKASFFLSKTFLGFTGKSPLVSSPCKCHYAGSLIDGTEFDSSYKRGGKFHSMGDCHGLFVVVVYYWLVSRLSSHLNSDFDVHSFNQTHSPWHPTKWLKVGPKPCNSWRKVLNGSCIFRRNSDTATGVRVERSPEVLLWFSPWSFWKSWENLSKKGKNE